MCSAAVGELLRVVRDQIGGVAIIVSNKESTIWRKTSVKTLPREKQLKYTDVKEMRVITNDRHIAEQIKSDIVRTGKLVAQLGRERPDEWTISWRI